jgi:phosphoserine aminotransferase
MFSPLFCGGLDRYGAKSYTKGHVLAVFADKDPTWIRNSVAPLPRSELTFHIQLSSTPQEQEYAAVQRSAIGVPVHDESKPGHV